MVVAPGRADADSEAEVGEAFLSTLPQLILVVLIGWFVLHYRRELVGVLEHRVTSVAAFGFKVDLAPADVDAAVRERSPRSEDAPTVDGAGQQVAERAQHMAMKTTGRTILWVDDHPEGNRNERRLLRQLGVFVEAVATNAEATAILGSNEETMDLVISDIERQDGTTGLALPAAIARSMQRPPVIFYVGGVDSTRGTPPGAMGIADRPDTLINLVLDAFDRMPDSPRVQKLG
jgi:CheY-like chemotaxis protein